METFSTEHRYWPGVLLLPYCWRFVLVTYYSGILVSATDNGRHHQEREASDNMLQPLSSHRAEDKTGKSATSAGKSAKATPPGESSQSPSPGQSEGSDDRNRLRPHGVEGKTGKSDGTRESAGKSAKPTPSEESNQSKLRRGPKISKSGKEGKTAKTANRRQMTDSGAKTEAH